MKKVLVTGANGFLGRRLVEQLLARGHAVRAFVLPGEAVPAHWSGRVELRRGDLTDAAAVTDAAAGMDAVVHLAALVGDGHTRAAQQRVTVGGTQNVVEAARRHRCHVILASSICAYGDHLQRGACPEDTPYGRPQGTYGWAKQRQEAVLRTLDPSAWTIIRPANIYGPGCKPWLEEAGAALRQGLPVIIGDGRGNAGLTYVDNVAELFCAALEQPAARGRVYNACDELEVSWAQYFSDLARLLGTPPPKRAPRLAVRLLALLAPPLWRLLRRRDRPPITREAYNLVGSDHRIPAERARRELGWTPRMSYADGMQAVAQSLRGS
ncbi:MAG TPA: NAD(P)-dependent oxidoreductase [Nevskiales bacterium]|nr:NAD(P)-dependent oxidoreductase [Nevskiales bacterium]